MSTLRRTLDATFTNPTGLPLHWSVLPISGAIRRFSAFSATEAVDAPVLSLANLGSGGGTLAAAGSGTAPTKKIDGGTHYLRFDGVDDVMTASVSDSAVTGPATLYSVVRLRTSPPANSTFAPASGATAASPYMSVAGSGNAAAGHDASSFTAGPNGGTNWRVIVATFNGAASTLQANLSVPATWNDAGTTALGTMKVGHRVSGFGDIDVAELGMFGSALSAGDRTELIGYLREVYSIA